MGRPRVMRKVPAGKAKPRTVREKVPEEQDVPDDRSEYTAYSEYTEYTEYTESELEGASEYTDETPRVKHKRSESARAPEVVNHLHKKCVTEAEARMVSCEQLVCAETLARKVGALTSYARARL